MIHRYTVAGLESARYPEGGFVLVCPHCGNRCTVDEWVDASHDRIVRCPVHRQIGWARTPDGVRLDVSRDAYTHSPVVTASLPSPTEHRPTVGSMSCRGLQTVEAAREALVRLGYASRREAERLREEAERLETFAARYGHGCSHREFVAGRKNRRGQDDGRYKLTETCVACNATRVAIYQDSGRRNRPDTLVEAGEWKTEAGR